MFMVKYIIMYSLLLLNYVYSENDNIIELENNYTAERWDLNNQDFNFPNNLVMELTDNWSLKNVSNQNLFIFSEDCEHNLQLCSNLIARIDKNEGSLNLDQVVDYFLLSINERFTKMKIVSIQDSLFNGIPMKIVDYKMQENGVDLGSTCALFLNKDEIISLSFTGKNVPEGSYLNERSKGIRMISSLRLKIDK